jgi:hypothetical protein
MDAGDLEKVTTKHITSLSAAFVGGIVPGLIAIYFFKPAWLLDFDVPKLLLFSAAITMPVFIFNCFMMDGSRGNPSTYWDEKVLMSGIFITAVFSLIPLLLMYIYPGVRSFRNFFAIVILLEAMLWGTVTIAQIWRYGLSWVLGVEELEVEKVVEKVIEGMGKEFSSHDVINVMRKDYSKTYYAFMRGRPVSAGHSLIAKMISGFEGIAVERAGDVSSQNVNEKLSKCAFWKKR